MDQGLNQSINQSMDQGLNQSINQSIDQGLNQSINRSRIQSINQWPLNRSIVQIVGTDVKWSMLLFILLLSNHRPDSIVAASKPTRTGSRTSRLHWVLKCRRRAAIWPSPWPSTGLAAAIRPPSLAVAPAWLPCSACAPSTRRGVRRNSSGSSCRPSRTSAASGSEWHSSSWWGSRSPASWRAASSAATPIDAFYHVYTLNFWEKNNRNFFLLSNCEWGGGGGVVL